MDGAGRLTVSPAVCGAETTNEWKRKLSHFAQPQNAGINTTRKRHAAREVWSWALWDMPTIHATVSCD
jgi:hypothetical protein